MMEKTLFHKGNKIILPELSPLKSVSIPLKQNSLQFYTDYMEDKCNTGLKMEEVGQHSLKLSLSMEKIYRANMNCTLTIEAQENSEYIMFYFRLLDIRPDGRCKYDWFQLRDGNSSKSPYVCGKS